MEAVALYNFRVDQDDELSFKKELILKVLKMEDHWSKAEHLPQCAGATDGYHTPIVLISPKTSCRLF